MKIVIWLDDLRDPESYPHRSLIRDRCPDADKVVWVKTVEEFREAFDLSTTSPNVELIGTFFDNDLGTKLEGRHAFTWMEERVRSRNLPPFTLHAQTANPAAKREMSLGFSALQAFWGANDGE